MFPDSEQTQQAQHQGHVVVEPQAEFHNEQEAMIFKQARAYMYARPKVNVLPNFLSPEECDHLIALSEAQLQPSTVVDPVTGRNIPSKDRSSYNAYFMQGQDQIISTIESRIANVTMLPVENGEGMQTLRYQLGQEYKAHYDYFDPALEGSQPPLEEGGQRVATVLMYLSEPEEGGETYFPEVGLFVRPARGNAILFWNVLPNMQVDPLSKHGSMPVITGEKWTATKWIRERAWVPIPRK